MAGTYNPIANTDDGSWVWTTFYDSLNYLFIGYGGGPPDASFIRFTNVTIPQGASITSCILKLFSSGTTADDPGDYPNVNIYFNNVGNAVAPTSVEEGEALVLTAAVTWTAIPNWEDFVQYSSPDLTAILQTVVDRGDFASGNAVQVVIKDDNSAGIRNACSFDSYAAWGEPPYLPELYVEWTEAFIPKITMII